MRLFTCETCKGVLFFENSRCMSCNQPIGFCAEVARLVPLPEEPVDNLTAPVGGTDDGGMPFAGSGNPGVAASSAAPEGAAPVNAEGVSVEVQLPGGKTEKFLKCKNFKDHDACNWLVRASEGQAFCLSCRLTEVIPDLSDLKNRQAWAEVENAKRRLLYTLRALRLPVVSKLDDADAGLAFRFLQGSPDAPVTTGHADGLITLNIAEADAAYRENMREKLGEAYRTVLGHLRHEIGHYYWDRLIRDDGRTDACRDLFGDESASYEAAIARHYDQGAPANWAESYISAYATMHPWEDWAETWAHYLHMLDTLETAKSHGLTVRVPGKVEGSARVSTDDLTFNDFEGLMSGWQAVTVALNSLSRSMGMKDVYPFVLSKPVRDKLHFVHQVIQQSAGKGLAGKGLALGGPASSASDQAATEKLMAEGGQQKKSGSAPASTSSPAVSAK